MIIFWFKNVKYSRLQFKNIAILQFQFIICWKESISYESFDLLRHSSLIFVSTSLQRKRSDFKRHCMWNWHGETQTTPICPHQHSGRGNGVRFTERHRGAGAVVILRRNKTHVQNEQWQILELSSVFLSSSISLNFSS